MCDRCLYMCLHLNVQVHMCVRMWKPEVGTSFSINSSSPCFFDSLSLDMGLVYSTAPTGQKASEFPVPASPAWKLCCCCQTWFFMWMLIVQTQILKLCSTYIIKWAISPAKLFTIDLYGPCCFSLYCFIQNVCKSTKIQIALSVIYITDIISSNNKESWLYSLILASCLGKIYVLYLKIKLQFVSRLNEIFVSNSGSAWVHWHIQFNLT